MDPEALSCESLLSLAEVVELTGVPRQAIMRYLRGGEKRRLLVAHREPVGMRYHYRLSVLPEVVSMYRRSCRRNGKIAQCKKRLRRWNVTRTKIPRCDFHRRGEGPSFPLRRGKAGPIDAPPDRSGADWERALLRGQQVQPVELGGLREQLELGAADRVNAAASHGVDGQGRPGQRERPATPGARRDELDDADTADRLGSGDRRSADLTPPDWEVV